MTRLAVMLMGRVKKTVALGSKGSIPETSFITPLPVKELPSADR
jgi:hypothetical protein